MSTTTGGCYCGDLRYEADGDTLMKVACHCRECQYISGGSANLIAGMEEDGFRYTKGEPAKFKRDDLEEGVTREFCGRCGTPILTRVPESPGAVFVKVGSMDSPENFGMPDAAIHTDDKYEFHTIAEGIAQFGKLPPM